MRAFKKRVSDSDKNWLYNAYYLPVDIRFVAPVSWEDIRVFQHVWALRTIMAIVGAQQEYWQRQRIVLSEQDRLYRWRSWKNSINLYSKDGGRAQLTKYLPNKRHRVHKSQFMLTYPGRSYSKLVSKLNFYKVCCHLDRMRYLASTLPCLDLNKLHIRLSGSAKKKNYWNCEPYSLDSKISPIFSFWSIKIQHIVDVFELLVWRPWHNPWYPRHSLRTMHQAVVWKLVVSRNCQWFNKPLILQEIVTVLWLRNTASSCSRFQVALGYEENCRITCKRKR